MWIYPSCLITKKYYLILYVLEQIQVSVFLKWPYQKVWPFLHFFIVEPPQLFSTIAIKNVSGLTSGFSWLEGRQRTNQRRSALSDSEAVMSYTVGTLLQQTKMKKLKIKQSLLTKCIFIVFKPFYELNLKRKNVFFHFFQYIQ